MSEPESLIAGLMYSQVMENRRSLKLTILHRPGGTWDPSEIGNLVCGLMTEVQEHPSFPEHVILYGHHTKEQTLHALMGGAAYTATQVTGRDDERLPWKPSGWVL